MFDLGLLSHFLRFQGSRRSPTLGHASYTTSAHERPGWYHILKTHHVAFLVTHSLLSSGLCGLHNMSATVCPKVALAHAVQRQVFGVSVFAAAAVETVAAVPGNLKVAVRGTCFAMMTMSLESLQVQAVCSVVGGGKNMHACCWDVTREGHQPSKREREEREEEEEE